MWFFSLPTVSHAHVDKHMMQLSCVYTPACSCCTHAGCLQSQQCGPSSAIYCCHVDASRSCLAMVRSVGLSVWFAICRCSTKVCALLSWARRLTFFAELVHHSRPCMEIVICPRLKIINVCLPRPECYTLSFASAAAVPPAVCEIDSCFCSICVMHHAVSAGSTHPGWSLSAKWQLPCHLISWLFQLMIVPWLFVLWCKLWLRLQLNSVCIALLLDILITSSLLCLCKWRQLKFTNEEVWRYRDRMQA
jgi:hypothetical protein